MNRRGTVDNMKLALPGSIGSIKTVVTRFDSKTHPEFRFPHEFESGGIIELIDEVFTNDNVIEIIVRSRIYISHPPSLLLFHRGLLLRNRY
jgi:hypothetical protein